MSANEIKQHLKQYAYFRSCLRLLSWDMESKMPGNAIKDRSKSLAFIQGKMHQHMTCAKYDKMLKSFIAAKGLSKKEARLGQELRWDFNLSKALPGDFVEEMAEVSSLSNHAWIKARKENSWKAFLPHLQKMINIKRQEIEYLRSKDKNNIFKTPYDALLMQFDKEFDSHSITKIFAELKSGLSNSLRKIEKKPHFRSPPSAIGVFPIPAQEQLDHHLAKLVGLKEGHYRLDTSTHPFSTNISPLDQRITTRYQDDCLSSFFTTLHEAGHALYESNLPANWEGTPFQEAISFSVHESQSRFWENIVGRSFEFCQYILPTLQSYFPTNYKGMTAQKLFYHFNHTEAGLIRVDSCEAYYNLHVIVRFEIEEMIFNQGLNAKDIPGIWKQKYQNYLGISATEDRHGPMQDGHWASGAFGYFPSYALGNLISAQLLNLLKKHNPSYKEQIRQGDFAQIRNFLKQKIHRYGREKNIQEIVGKLSAAPFLQYLDAKFEA